MSKRITFSELLDTIGSAINVAAAVENHGKVKARHLRTLGIDPVQFEKIRR
jgi:hypothetical protein